MLDNFIKQNVQFSTWKKKTHAETSRVSLLQVLFSFQSDFQGLFFQLRLPSQKNPQKSSKIPGFLSNLLDPWDPPAWTPFRIRPGKIPDETCDLGWLEKVAICWLVRSQQLRTEILEEKKTVAS